MLNFSYKKKKFTLEILKKKKWYVKSFGITTFSRNTCFKFIIQCEVIVNSSFEGNNTKRKNKNTFRKKSKEYFSDLCF